MLGLLCSVESVVSGIANLESVVLGVLCTYSVLNSLSDLISTARLWGWFAQGMGDTSLFPLVLHPSSVLENFVQSQCSRTGSKFMVPDMCKWKTSLRLMDPFCLQIGVLQHGEGIVTLKKGCVSGASHLREGRGGEETIVLGAENGYHCGGSFP